MKILGLDLSKANSGVAGWDSEMSQPLVLSKSLGDGRLTKHGTVFARLHMLLSECAQVLGGVDAIYCEEPLQPQGLSRVTTFETLYLNYGLAAHAESFAAAKSIRFMVINQSVWRRHFIGNIKRGTKSKTLKEYAMERCAQLGLKPRNHDEADALGILDYGCDREGIIPPWRKNEVLLAPLVRAEHA